MDKIFVSGGLDFDGTESNCLSVAKTFRRYDVRAGKWEKLRPLPVPRYMHASVIMAGSVYVIGGCDVAAASPPHSAVIPSNEIFRFNNCTWRRLRPMANRRCFFGAVAMPDGLIYVLGGQGENNYVHNSVERFDVRTNSWETMRSMPIPRLGFGIATVGHNVYIAGGMTGSLRILNRLDIYDTRTNTWKSGPALPFPRAFPSMIALPQKRGGQVGHAAPSHNVSLLRTTELAAKDETTLYIVGGFVAVPDMTLNDVIPVSAPDVTRLKVNQENTSWETIQRLTTARTFPHLIPTTPDAFIIIGGFNQETATEEKSPQLYSQKKVYRDDGFFRPDQEESHSPRALSNVSSHTDTSPPSAATAPVDDRAARIRLARERLSSPKARRMGRRAVGHALGGTVGVIPVSMAGAAIDARRRRRSEKAKMRRAQPGKNVNAVGTGYEHDGVAINADSYRGTNSEGHNDVNDNYNCKYTSGSPFGKCSEKTIENPGSKYGQRYVTRPTPISLYQNTNNENGFEDEDQQEFEDEVMDRLEPTESQEEDNQEENEEDGEEERQMPIPVIEKLVEDGLEEAEEYDDGLGILLSFSHAEGDWFGSILTKCCANEETATLIGAATCYQN